MWVFADRTHCSQTELSVHRPNSAFTDQTQRSQTTVYLIITTYHISRDVAAKLKIELEFINVPTRFRIRTNQLNCCPFCVGNLWWESVVWQPKYISVSGSHCKKGSAPPHPHTRKSCFVKGEKQLCEAELPILVTGRADGEYTVLPALHSVLAYKSFLVPSLPPSSRDSKIFG